MSSGVASADSFFQTKAFPPPRSIRTPIPLPRWYPTLPNFRTFSPEISSSATKPAFSTAGYRANCSKVTNWKPAFRRISRRAACAGVKGGSEISGMILPFPHPGVELLARDGVEHHANSFMNGFPFKAHADSFHHPERIPVGRLGDGDDPFEIAHLETVS